MTQYTASSSRNVQLSQLEIFLLPCDVDIRALAPLSSSARVVEHQEVSRPKEKGPDVLNVLERKAIAEILF